MKYVKDNNIWKNAIQFYNSSGSWKRVKEISSKDKDSWKSTIPPVGTFVEGGYVAGIMDTIQSGGERYLLLVSEKKTQIIDAWYKYGTNPNNNTATSKWNGLENTIKLANTNFPAANYCANLDLNGYTDWYLPAIDELELIYRNLKATDVVNDESKSSYTRSRDYNFNYPGHSNGYNLNTDPLGESYYTVTTDGYVYDMPSDAWYTDGYKKLTNGYPMKTPVGIFQQNQRESFWPPAYYIANKPVYWSSTWDNVYNFNPFHLFFYVTHCGNYGTRSGKQTSIYSNYLSSGGYVRAVRRILI